MTNKEKLLQQAIALNKDDKYQVVDDLLTDEILEEHKDVDLYAEKVMALYRLNKHEECERKAKRANELNSNNTIINNYIGTLLYDRGDYENAIIHYKNALDISSNVASYVGLGNTYTRLNQYKRAIESYDEAKKIDPNKTLIYYNTGVTFYNDQNYEKATENFLEAIRLSPDHNYSHYYLGLIANIEGDYIKSKTYFRKYIDYVVDDQEYFSKLAQSKIQEIDSILESKQYEKITYTTSKIKELLLFKKGNVTHYTGISIAKFLILDETQFRISEGAFLNDTSEGTILFDYLNFDTSTHNNCGPNASVFSKKPFIGSFVNQTKNNDLTLWRMYGKENLEEAKGCAITIDIDELKESIKQKLKTGNDGLKDFEELEFYKVAYLENNKFTFSEPRPKQVTKLNSLMKELQSEVIEFRDKPDKKPHETLKIIELLNEVAYLFKNAEYQYQNEVRLVMKDAIGFDKIIDTAFTPPKVYVELVSILPMIKQITIGPKVDRADEWAAAFHYQFLEKDLKPEISISNLPFK